MRKSSSPSCVSSAPVSIVLETKPFFMSILGASKDLPKTLLECGFLKGKWVETNLCCFLDYTVLFVRGCEQVDVVECFDRSKAFDKVNRSVLCKLD